MIYYNILVILIYFIGLYFILIRWQDLFSVKSFLYIISVTWIFGALFCENGFFAWPDDYVEDPHNYSSLILLTTVFLIYSVAKVVSDTSEKRYMIAYKRQLKFSNQGITLVSVGILLFSFLFTLYILKSGAPFFADNPDIARTLFWGEKVSPIFKRIIVLFLPAYYVFLYLFRKKRIHNYLFILNILSYLVLCILLSQKSNILLIVFPLYFVYFYKNRKVINIKRNIIVGFTLGMTLFLVMSYTAYHNMTDELLVHGKKMEKSFTTGMLVFGSRVTLGQGEPYWRIYNDHIINSEKTLGLKGVENFSQTMINSKVFGVSLSKEESFEYWITERLTADWFAETRNLVVTFVGEGIIYFGLYGILLFTFLLISFIVFFDFILKYTIDRMLYTWFIVWLTIFNYKITAWMQMGSFFNVFRIMDYAYIILLLISLFILNLIVKTKIYKENI